MMRDEAPPLAEPSVAVPGCLKDIALAKPYIVDEETVRLISAGERIYNERAFASEQER